jgi:hypothetical protein
MSAQISHKLLQITQLIISGLLIYEFLRLQFFERFRKCNTSERACSNAFVDGINFLFIQDFTYFENANTSARASSKAFVDEINFHFIQESTYKQI